jgi:hypothetical protein
MTFRDDNDALRERIIELEKAIADARDPAPAPKPVARFEITRGPKRMFWWLVGTEIMGDDVPANILSVGYVFLLLILLVTGSVPGADGHRMARADEALGLGAGMFVLMLLRIWLRFAMALDVKESRDAWARRFG